jgi:hypothetical protein
MSDFDSPWKEALDRFLQAFLEFFFPLAALGINWGRGYEVLDKELEQIVREGETGKRYADKLFKVCLKSGEEAWLLIHVEIQSQKDDDFARRMYRYNYRIYDRFDHPVASFAVLGDEYPNWRPNQFSYTALGSVAMLQYPITKLLDFIPLMPLLENQDNPFALIVLTHLKSLETKKDPQDRCVWKIRLTKALLDQGKDGEYIRLLFKFIDWMIDLPEELATKFEYEIDAYEKEKKMTYITTIERKGIEKGRREFLVEMLEKKFGPLSSKAKETLNTLSSDRLSEIGEALLKDKSLKDLGLED